MPALRNKDYGLTRIAGRYAVHRVEGPPAIGITDDGTSDARGTQVAGHRQCLGFNPRNHGNLHPTRLGELRGRHDTRTIGTGGNLGLTDELIGPEENQDGARRDLLVVHVRSTDPGRPKPDIRK